MEGAENSSTFLQIVKEKQMSYSEIILSTHAFIPKSELKKSLYALRDSFTLVSKYESDIAVDIYAETETHFGFPLHYSDFSLHTDNLIDKRSLGQAAQFSMCENFELRDAQKTLLEKFLHPGAKVRTGWLLSMSTGSGKTVVGIRMLQHLGRTALVIVPRQALVEQWIERFLQFTDMSREDIGIAQQDVCDFRGRKVVIGMVHSLSKDKYSDEFKNYFGTVLYDECHTLGAQTFSQTVGMFPAKYRIGMSATMNRKDGLEDVYRYSVGEVVLEPKKIKTLVQPKVFLRAYKAIKKHPYLEKMKDSKLRRGKLISELSNDLARNALIAVYAKKFSESDRRVVIFSDRVEQLKLLRDLLTKRHGMSLAAIGLFTGSTKEGDRKIILEHSKIILATYGVMAMGVDVPDLRAVIFATPLSDVAQSVGRILRLCEGAKDPVVLDIVDTSYYDCVRWSHKRQEYYKNTANAKLYELK